jgi:hypothetical protein
MNSVMMRYAAHLASGGADIETPQGMVDLLNSLGRGFTWSLTDGREGMSVIGMDEARARIERKRAKRQASCLQSESDL